jgi:hypothetical protein
MRSEGRKCLSDSEFGAYIEGGLSSGRKEAIESHLAGCQKCWKEFVAINRVIIREDAPVENVLEYLIEKALGMFPDKISVFDIVLNLLRDSVKVFYCSPDINIFTPLPVPALRGEKAMPPEMIVLKKSFEDIEVELDIEKVAGSLCNIRVAVDDLSRKILMNTLRVELISDDRELVSSLLEDGETVLEDLGLGKYTIRINKKGKTLGEIALKIK